MSHSAGNELVSFDIISRSCHAKSCCTSARVNIYDNGKIKGNLGWEEGDDCKLCEPDCREYM